MPGRVVALPVEIIILGAEAWNVPFVARRGLRVRRGAHAGRSTRVLIQSTGSCDRRPVKAQTRSARLPTQTAIVLYRRDVGLRRDALFAQ